MNSSINRKKNIAFIYDFDRTLSKNDMQSYGLFKKFQIEDEKAFWEKSNNEKDSDRILSYLRLLLERNKKIKRNDLVECGKDIEFFEGIDTWFERINNYCEQRGFKSKHFIISAGQKEIIEGCKIYDKFEAVYASEFHYNKKGFADWPKNIINYTMKTQYLFRINKGQLTDDKLNKGMPENERDVAFDRMIYIGDGYTDVPAMKLVKQLGGHSIAVYDDLSTTENYKAISNIIEFDRVNYVCRADYRKDSELSNTVKTLIDYITRKSIYKDVDKIK